MYPDPNVPLWEIPRKHNKYHGYTYVRGTPNCPLNCKIFLSSNSDNLELLLRPRFPAILGEDIANP